MALMNDMKERGIELPWGADEEESEAASETDQEWGVAPEQLTTELDVAAWADHKRACMDCHKTQRQDMGWLLDLPEDLQARAISPEYYVLRKWRDREVPNGYRETSVFD
jgi:LmbE family N-acetylglucosaminyl deacetylase